MKKYAQNVSKSQITRSPKGPMILKEVKAAANNKVALLGGVLLGGFIPFAVYWLMHREAPSATPICEMGGHPIVFAHFLVLGGLAYSAKTVYQWGKAVFADRFKAVGFTLLVEGILTFGHSNCLIFPALGILVLINGIAATSRLAETDTRVYTPRQPRKTEELLRIKNRQANGLIKTVALAKPEISADSRAIAQA